MKWIILLLVVLLVGCAQVQRQVDFLMETDPAKINVDLPENKTYKPLPLPEEEGPDAAELLFQKAYENAAKGYQYVYGRPETSSDYWRVYTKGPYMKIVMSDRVKVGKDYYDTVYIDVAKETAIGYCESRKCLEETALVLDYSDFYVPPPHLRIPDIRGHKILKEKERWNKRDAMVIEYLNIYGEVTRTWVDTFYGFPIRLDTLNYLSEVKFQETYEDIAVGVKGEDIIR